MRPTILLCTLAAGCVQPIASRASIAGAIDRSDPAFLADDPASHRHCAGDADCPLGALCHPGTHACFSSGPSPRMLEIADVQPERDDDHRPCQLVRVYFPSDSAELVDEARRTLAWDARCLAARGATFVILDGFTDPRGSHVHNVALSRRRCEATATYLREAEGVELPFEMVPLAERRPLVAGDTELARAHDRRVELHFVAVAP